MIVSGILDFVEETEKNAKQSFSRRITQVEQGF